MSHGSAGIETQALLIVFAANFVCWAAQRVRKRVEHSTSRFEMVLGSPKRLVQVAANSPAIVERRSGRETVHSSPLSCFDGVVIRVSDEPACLQPIGVRVQAQAEGGP